MEKLKAEVNVKTNLDYVTNCFEDKESFDALLISDCFYKIIVFIYYVCLRKLSM